MNFHHFPFHLLQVGGNNYTTWSLHLIANTVMFVKFVNAQTEIIKAVSGAQLRTCYVA